MNKYLADRSYYAAVLRVGIPLALTMLLQSCMNIIDSIMVSSIGMVTAVGNATNVLMLHSGINWGIISGIAVFGAQFFGAYQEDNMNRTLGLSLCLTLSNAFLWTFVVYFFGKEILLFYLDDADLLIPSLSYLRIAVLALIPDSFVASFSTMYKSTHNTRLPFFLSVLMALFNICLNYYFIYILKIGVVGAAYGTLLASLLIAIIYFVIILINRPVFLQEFKLLFSFKLSFVKPIVLTMLPIMINETFFGFGCSLFNKAYGLLGTQAMDAYYVANQIMNLFLFAVWGFGGAVSILIGTTLGHGDIDRARKEADYQLGIGFALGIFLSCLMIFCGPLFISFFHVDNLSTFNLAKQCLYVFSLKIFIRTFTYMMFSTLKAGGDARILNLYDSGFMYLIGIPSAFLAVYLGLKSVALVLLICQIEQMVRFVFTLRRFKSGIWARDLTREVG